MEKDHDDREARPKPKESITLYNTIRETFSFFFIWFIRYVKGIGQPNVLRLGEDTCKCVHYTVPVTCWPRIKKSQQLIRHLSDRCLYMLEHTIGWQKEPNEDFTKIDIYIDNNVQTDLVQLLVREDTFEKKETLLPRVYERNMPKGFSLIDNFSGLYIDKRGVKFVENVTSERIDVVTVDLAEDESITTESQHFDTKQTKCEIIALLECVVFENLTSTYQLLKMTYKYFTISPAMEPSFSELNEICKDDEAYDFVMTQKRTIEQLLGEITTMFKRSALPKHKMPHLFGFEKQQLSKEVKQQLFRFDDTIRSFGYSNSTFHVNVESLSSVDEETDRKKRIKEFLAKFGVTNVKFNNVSKGVSEYRFVGANVATKKRIEGDEKYTHGTLGGFASMEEKSPCVLFSRHVGRGCNENKLYVNDNGNLTEFGEIIEGTLEGGSYDIAAAKVHDLHASSCDFQYKNSENIPRPGKLQSAATDLELQNLPVHLWGAKSKPGLGIITIPELCFPNPDDSYMQIADREPVEGQTVQRMAVEGDSGAVVCADDLDDEIVHVIGMLIGSNNAEVTKDSPATKGTYVAFPLQKGVELLKKKTNCKFSLKGVSNN